MIEITEDIWELELLGVPEMDSQHAYFLTLLRKLHHCQDLAKIKSLLEDLYSCLELHCEYEEKLMNIYGYQDSHDHASHHSQWLMSLSQMIEDTVSGVQSKNKTVLSLLTWLINHTKFEDRVAAEHILEVRKKLQDI